ncbi:MAG: hypothetical protein H6Q74_244 [Firmicutes bacterium]|nr:hypothetical protein [Bacillota bacterium]
MRVSTWWGAFVLAATLHATGLVLAGHSILVPDESIVENVSNQTIEIELEQPELLESEALIAAQDSSPAFSASPLPQAKVSPWRDETKPAAAVAAVVVASPAISAADDGDDNQIAVSLAGANGTGQSGSGGGSSGNARGGGGGYSDSDGGVTSLPQAISTPSPEFPAEARLNRWQGTVAVKVLVTPSGEVEEVRLAKSSGYDVLDRATINKAYQWQFTPAYRNGQPVARWIIRSIVFKLK